MDALGPLLGLLGTAAGLALVLEVSARMRRKK